MKKTSILKGKSKNLLALGRDVFSKPQRKFPHTNLHRYPTKTDLRIEIDPPNTRSEKTSDIANNRLDCYQCHSPTKCEIRRSFSENSSARMGASHHILNKARKSKASKPSCQTEEELDNDRINKNIKIPPRYRKSPYPRRISNTLHQDHIKKERASIDRSSPECNSRRNPSPCLRPTSISNKDSPFAPAFPERTAIKQTFSPKYNPAITDSCLDFNEKSTVPEKSNRSFDSYPPVNFLFSFFENKIEIDYLGQRKIFLEVIGDSTMDENGLVIYFDKDSTSIPRIVKMSSN